MDGCGVSFVYLIPSDMGVKTHASVFHSEFVFLIFGVHMDEVTKKYAPSQPSFGS